MSDLLDDLVKASREAPVVHDEADETRRRILAAANHRARTTSGRRLSPWVLPLVAALVATGALAAGPLGVTQALFGPAPTAVPTVAPPATAVAVRGTAAPSRATAEAADDAVPPPPEAVPAPTTASPPVAVLPTPSVDPAPPATAAPAPAAIPSAPVARTEPSHAAAAPIARANATSAPAAVVARPEAPAAAEPRPETAAPQAAPTPPVPPPDPSDDLYRTAHDRHFRGGDPSSAVEAWDRYLAAAPRGRFAVEARYNRALALLKAGRRSEGLAALEPFANGAFGQYRREEAQRLLGAARDAGAP